MKGTIKFYLVAVATEIASPKNLGVLLVNMKCLL